jgi:hypothetical protein
MDPLSYQKIKEYQKKFEEKSSTDSRSSSAPAEFSPKMLGHIYDGIVDITAIAKAALRSTFSMNEVVPSSEKEQISHSESGSLVGMDAASPTLTTTMVGIIASLVSVSESIKPAAGGERWYMRPEARRKILEKVSIDFSPESILELLPPGLGRNRDVTQKMITAYVRGNAAKAQELTYEELSSTLQIESWLRTLVKDMPTRDELQYWREFQEMLIPFRKLTREFNGRKEELARLTSYVQWLPAANLSDRVHRITDFLFDLKEKPPLVITGMGGIGKSTIVAKFILSHIDGKDSGQRLPFVYLDFDRPGLSFNEPLTMLLEGARQLSLQLGRQGVAMADFYAAQKKRLGRLSENVTSSASSDEENESLDGFARAWETIDPQFDRPLLMVLDSFEEVQARLGSRLEEVFLFLEKTVNRIPRLRVVVSGRWPVTFKSEELQVGDFDDEAAIGYLKSFGVDDPEVAKLIYKKYKGNPLTLRLAADWLFKKIDEEQIQ